MNIEKEYTEEKTTPGNTYRNENKNTIYREADRITKNIKNMTMLKPECHQTEIYSKIDARVKSIENKNTSFYVYYNQAGYYLVDTSGEIYAGEKLIAQYLNGEKI